VDPPARGGRTMPTGPARPAVTIRDVAARAGVSTATVSRVLAGVSRGRATTRERVLAAAGELEYRPSGVARSLKLRVTHTLGLIITDISNPFFPELVRGAEDRARELGYALLLGNGSEDPEREAAYLELFASRRVDGMIIAAASVTERHARSLRRASLPAVLLNCEIEDRSLAAALSDNRAGGRMVAEHLLSLGHRALGLVTTVAADPAAHDRALGLRETLAAAGLDPDDLVTEEAPRTVAGGHAAMQRLLMRSPHVTGVACYNDVMAIGALRGARASGRSVPADISIVGFDDIDLAAYAEPPLTTVAQQTSALGRWGVDRLVATIRALAERREPDPPTTVRMPVRLVVRATTAPAPAPR
jgi:LacI family transcriptional regulator